MPAKRLTMRKIRVHIHRELHRYQRFLIDDRLDHPRPAGACQAGPAVRQNLRTAAQNMVQVGRVGGDVHLAYQS